jgi:hypothetical protein
MIVTAATISIRSRSYRILSSFSRLWSHNKSDLIDLQNVFENDLKIT